VAALAGDAGVVAEPGASARLHAPSAVAVAVACLIGIAAGALLHLLGHGREGDWAWAAMTALLLLPLGWSVARTLLRRDVGVDAIALVSMAGALALQEYLAGAVIALMLAGGNALEERAGARARRELRALVERAPRSARLLREGDVLEEVPVERVAAGDLVLVRPGEVLPVDGIVEGEEAVLDEAALTGESLPVVHSTGDGVRSGTVNVGSPVRLRALRPAVESAYAAVVRLVREAEAQRAPFVRLADRYAAAFLPVTAAAAGIAWAASGDPVRALAVFVVATPCPLILAAPIAFLSGISRAAHLGVVVKGAGVIERLGSARTVVLDKTGTLTLGTPRLERLTRLDGLDENETLRLAASLDQVSPHPFAAALVREARSRGLALAYPNEATEQPGRGIEGCVDRRRVAVGSETLLRELGYDGHSRVANQGSPGEATILIGVDGRLTAELELSDPPREGALGLADRLREAGVVHVAMLTGDRVDIAETLGTRLGVDRVYAEQSPEQKLEVVAAIRARPGLAPLVMVGDGINDAPALALADVGIAMGSAGATAASETADALILVDRIDRVADAISIGHRSLFIARQSVLGGIGLSLAAMVFAGLGLIAPVGGALLQEVVDVAVILNALRALRG
jgi:heavy metal translocating P-type ATPase